jgi:hypothetical protein
VDRLSNQEIVEQMKARELNVDAVIIANIMYFGNNIHTPKGGTLHLEVRGQDAPKSYEICANFPVRSLKQAAYGL